jgi:hypothetical protein
VSRPRLRGPVRRALDREEDPVASGALSVAAYPLGDRDGRLLEDARRAAVGEDALADHVDVIEALIERREPPKHASALAEYLFDAAAIASGERPPAGPGDVGH